MEAPRPASPRLLRSRSGTPRLCQLSAAETLPFNPNLARPKSRPQSPSAASSLRRPKENREAPSPLPPPEACGRSRRAAAVAAVRPCSAAPSAWALSPGRSRQAPLEKRGTGGGGGGVLGLFRRRKEPPAREEAVHQLRMLATRLLQWRFANARAEAAMESTKFKAEVRGPNGPNIGSNVGFAVGLSTVEFAARRISAVRLLDPFTGPRGGL